MSHDPTIRRPDEEDLTAFAEGCLEEKWRQPVLDRLASDPDYYELYVELLRFQEEELPLDAESSMAPTPREDAPSPDRTPPTDAATVLTSTRWRRWSAPWIGVAAGIVLAISAFWILPQIMPAPPTAEGLLTGLEPRPEDLIEAPGEILRSGSGAESSVRRLDLDDSFLLGALLIDLHFPATDKSRRAPEIELERLLEKTAFLGLLWRECTDPHPICAEKLIESGWVDVQATRLGMWSRAAWFAARAGDASYLEGPAVISGMEGLLRGAKDEASRAELLELKSALTAGDLGALQKAVEDVSDNYRAGFKPDADFYPGDSERRDSQEPDDR